MKKTDKKDILNDIEEKIQYEYDSNDLPPEDVFAFNELRSCADLHRLNKQGTLEVKPFFQRNLVWKSPDQTRFIDSLLKNLPIPSLCFSLDSKTRKMQVIDGLQRISVICKFLDDDSWKLSELEDIDKRISGKTVSDIRENHKEIYEMIQNVSIPVTLLRCDLSKPNHSEYIFTIFHRLNAGGLKLTNQEIRNAIFSGKFNDFLKTCNDEENWKKLLSQSTRQKNQDDRFKSVEMILRFFAFLDSLKTYDGKLASFLNNFMQKNRVLPDTDLDKKTDLFNRTVAVLKDRIFIGKDKISNVVFESVLYGVAKNIDFLETVTDQNLNKYYKNVLSDSVFSKEEISEGLYGKTKLFNRLSTAERIFSGVK